MNTFSKGSSALSGLWGCVKIVSFRGGASGTPAECEAKQHLYEPSCSGALCYQYIVNQAAAQARCGGLYFNPYVAVAIALNESGGLVSTEPDGSNVKHFGCDPFGRLGVGGTPVEKFACMINTFANACNAGKTEAEALAEYGYSPTHNLNNLVKILGLNIGTQPSGYAFNLWINQSTAANYRGSLLSTLPGQQQLWFRYYEGYINAFCQ